jgi:hypothetical protein
MTYPKQDSISNIVTDLLELLYSRDLLTRDQYSAFQDRLYWTDKKERSTHRLPNRRDRL